MEPVNDVHPVPRPRPLLTAAGEVQVMHAPLAGLVTALVSGGIITATAGNLTAALLGLVPGVLTTAAAMLGAHHVAAVADQVTPLVAPMAEDPITGKLVRLVPSTLSKP